MTEICECGHTKECHGKSQHRYTKGEGCYALIDNGNCKCKKFKPQNYSPQQEAESSDTPEEKTNFLLKSVSTSGNFNLSEKIGEKIVFGDSISVKNVKEFIKRLKESFKAGSWEVWQIHKEIDKLAGDKLI